MTKLEQIVKEETQTTRKLSELIDFLIQRATLSAHMGPNSGYSPGDLVKRLSPAERELLSLVTSEDFNRRI